MADVSARPDSAEMGNVVRAFILPGEAGRQQDNWEEFGGKAGCVLAHAAHGEREHLVPSIKRTVSRSVGARNWKGRASDSSRLVWPMFR